MNLFICNQGKNRSKTAAEVFGGFYCGIFSQDNPLTKEKLESADVIYVFEEQQRKFIADNFPSEYLSKRILNLDIPDIYCYRDEKLIIKLKKKWKENKDI